MDLKSNYPGARFLHDQLQFLKISNFQRSREWAGGVAGAGCLHSMSIPRYKRIHPDIHSVVSYIVNWYRR